MLQTAEDLRLAPTVGRDLQDDRASAQGIVKREVDPRRPATPQFPTDRELLEGRPRHRKPRRRRDRAGHLADHPVILELRLQRVFPGRVTAAEFRRVRPRPVFLTQAKFLVDQAQHPVRFGRQRGKTLEVFVRFRAFTARVPQGEVGLDERRQDRGRDRCIGMCGPECFQFRTACLPGGFQAANGGGDVQSFRVIAVGRG